ncbi:ATP-binding cassette domain-containing protein [Nocardiopsis sp. CNT-189]|uniref:ABC transporter permease subunit n=1 Tax=Nocardiopsis oceanisediminis TaxID=2816862 RepID=UPI003B322570
MAELLAYIVSGLVTGSVFAVMASGLVLTHAATGVFNFAHGAIGFATAFLYFQLHTGAGLPAPVALAIAVGLFAPGLGYLLHRTMFDRLAGAGATAQTVAAIALTVALPAAALWTVHVLNGTFGLRLPSGDDQFTVPGIGPSPVVAWRPLDLFTLTSNQVAAFAAAALAAAGLWALLRRTPLGLRMRAAADRRDLAALRGTDPGRTSAAAWALGSALAGLAGVVVAPFLGLDATAFTVLLFSSATAAVCGRLRSVPIAFAAGLGLGVLQNLAVGYLPFTDRVRGLATAVPVLLLFAALLVMGAHRGRIAGAMAEDAPPPDHRAGLPPWRRALPWAASGAALAVWALAFAPHFWLGLAVQGLAYGLIFTSFVLITGIGGMVNLAMPAFVAAAALTTAIAYSSGVPLFAAVLLGIAVSVLLGLVAAVPSLRLGGLALALATLALALLADQILFQLDAVTNGNEGWPLPGIAGLTDRRAQVLALLALLAGAALLLRNLERSATGRAVLAVRSAPAAALTSGVSQVRTKLLLFVLASGVAGLGGVLLAVFNGRVTADAFPAVTGFVWLAVAVIHGVRRVGPAVAAGLVFALAPEVLSHVSDSAHLLTALFGLGGLVLARRPDGLFSRPAEPRRRRRAAPAARTAPPVPDPGGEDRPAALRLAGVSAGYGDVPVLRGVDLEVPAGRITALLGPNGAGKSTLCGAAAGTVPATGGAVLLGGRDVTAAPAHLRARAGLFLAPEGRGVFPSLTVEENLATWLRAPAEREEALDRLPLLARRRTTPAGRLSGGEQQLLALAPALVRPPAVLIADEPSLGLAPKAAEQVFAVFTELRAAGTALLVVEEKPKGILPIADTAAFMAAGERVWSGPSAEVGEERLAEAYLGPGRGPGPDERARQVQEVGEAHENR